MKQNEKGGIIMSVYEEYLSQAAGNSTDTYCDEHTDRWIDEASESTYGHSGHCDSHADEAN